MINILFSIMMHINLLLEVFALILMEIILLQVEKQLRIPQSKYGISDKEDSALSYKVKNKINYIFI